MTEDMDVRQAAAQRAVTAAPQVLTDEMRMFLKARRKDLTVRAVGEFIVHFHLTAADCHLALQQFLLEEYEHREVEMRCR